MCFVYFFFFKQKTAYEMRISDWSSDVCSSDLSERLETGRRSLDRADVEPWLDGFMASSLPRGDIAGATVAIAKDGEVLLTKGYGYADTQKRVPVDADRHLFRVASISKLFHWPAAMPQDERGRIDPIGRAAGRGREGTNW